MMYDVAIIGGGPAGSTAGSLLRKYNPELRVLICEREKFPRDHVGESQLPVIGDILHEMGVWEKVEAADFPVKIGATYRWGATPDLWDFSFVHEYDDPPRPAKYEGTRTRTAFQVDRAVYDDILLRHAEEMGCEVREETKVAEVLRDGDKVMGLRLESGDVITARYYVDASGASGILRRAMGVEVDEPTALRNIAIWDYWQDAEWAVTIGKGGTRVQVMSLGYGWIWFIPIRPTRTSLGLIVPAEYYKKSGKKPEELYVEAIAQEPLISKLVQKATREHRLQTTRDWSFTVERSAGDNWFLCGEAAGFADPILAAGLSMAHVGAKEVAYTILELDRGRHGATWLKTNLSERQTRRVRQHIRFADYWYTANGLFTDLVNETKNIAEEAGLDLDAQSAWQWLGTGGFIDDDLDTAGFSSYSLAGVKRITELMAKGEDEWNIASYNVFRLNLQGAKFDHRPFYKDGMIEKVPCYRRGNRTLSLIGPFATLVELLKKNENIFDIRRAFGEFAESHQDLADPGIITWLLIEGLEAMVVDGWVEAKRYKSLPLMARPTLEQGFIQMNTDINDPKKELAT